MDRWKSKVMVGFIFYTIFSGITLLVLWKKIALCERSDSSASGSVRLNPYQRLLTRSEHKQSEL